MINRRVEGQQGSARRRLFWEEEGAIAAAPQRPPARPGGPLPGDRSYSPRESRRDISHTLDSRPAYRGGGYGFISQAREGEERGRGLPRSNQERAARHESLFPGTPLPPRGTGLGISQEYAPIMPTIWKSLLGGLGIGTGILIVNKLIKK